MTASSRRSVLALFLALATSTCAESTTLTIDGGPLSCTSDRTCSEHGLVCERSRGVCVECVGPFDCTGEDEVCLGGDCVPRVECTSSRMCPGLVCDPMRGYCVQCVGPADCAVGEACSDGSCATAPPPECETDADCGEGLRCAMGRCEARPHCTVDGDCGSGLRCAEGSCVAQTCASDAECDDAVFCNGSERCAPGTSGATPTGCVAAVPPCAASACDEAASACTSCDADFDGHRALGCGGDDCDDDDPMVRPGGTELCDGLDSDCSTGGGLAGDEDADDDGFAPVEGSCSEGPLPATDCDDTNADVRPTATEVCNGVDDDCDGLVDEPPAGTECASGEVCFAGRCGTPPPGGITQIAASANHGCALHSSGSVYCWGGEPGLGALGDGTDMRNTAGPPVTGLTDAVAIDAGSNHTCAIRATGGLVCWGYGAFGQIGDGETTYSRPTPRAVIGLGGTVNAVAGAGISTCARLSTGEVQCWGDSRSGQVGDGTTAVRPSPVYVPGLSSIVSVHGGYENACARRADRSFACWGENDLGQLGDGTSGTDRLSPVTGFSPPLLVDDLAVGGPYTCARIGGAVSCWGRLPGTTTMSLTPEPVPGIADAAQIAAGFDFACVRRTTGAVLCWGNNEVGQLGVGTSGSSTSTSAPSMPVSGLSDVRHLALGRSGRHACALRATGQVVCWGWNFRGQLGDGTMTDRSTPVNVLGLPP